jgi:hypothetical protein
MPTAGQISALKAAARAIPLNSPPVRVTDFISGHFQLNPVQQADLVTTGFAGATLAMWVAYITEERKVILDRECALPPFVVYTDALGADQISGLQPYLTTRGKSPQFVTRIGLHNQIRSALIGLAQGHHLEAIGAAILNGLSVSGRATRGSGDQGIDFIGRRTLVPIDPAFINGSLPEIRALPGDNAFVLGSSKAPRSSATTRPLLSPHYVRELIGGWTIQRSQAGLWREQGIKMMSPVQMVLLTTYQLSADAKRLCNIVGVQLWTLPELISLVCEAAPNNVFQNAAGAPRIMTAAFRTWWMAHHNNRLAVP